MHLVLIHWKIIRNEQAVQDFLRYWSEVLVVPDRSGLVAEFLSAPIRPEETGLFYDSIALQDTPAYYSFINIGLWKDVTSFQEQVDRPYRTWHRQAPVRAREASGDAVAADPVASWRCKSSAT
jgi:hypothetical protein